MAIHGIMSSLACFIHSAQFRHFSQLFWFSNSYDVLYCKFCPLRILVHLSFFLLFILAPLIGNTLFLSIVLSIKRELAGNNPFCHLTLMWFMGKGCTMNKFRMRVLYMGTFFLIFLFWQTTIFGQNFFFFGYSRSAENLIFLVEWNLGKKCFANWPEAPDYYWNKQSNLLQRQIKWL